MKVFPEVVTEKAFGKLLNHPFNFLKNTVNKVNSSLIFPNAFLKCSEMILLSPYHSAQESLRSSQDCFVSLYFSLDCSVLIDSGLPKCP